MGVETLLVAGLVMSAAGTAYSVYSQNKAANAAEDVAKKNAAMEMEAANKDAANIREKAARLKGMQSAAMAAGGVSLGSGSADAILGETDRLSEQDALAVIKEGSQRASIIRDQGSLTASNYRAQAVATALGGVSDLANGASSYKQVTQGARAANTINLNTDKALATRKTPTYSLLGG